MASMTTQALSASSVAIRPPTTRPSVRTGSFGAIAAMALAMAMLVLMAPSLARVPATTGAPGRLEAPASVIGARPLPSHAAAPIVGSTPEPGPHPGH